MENQPSAIGDGKLVFSHATASFEDQGSGTVCIMPWSGSDCRTVGGWVQECRSNLQGPSNVLLHCRSVCGQIFNSRMVS